MHYKQNNKERKSYVQGLRSFGNTLPRGIKGILKKNGYNYSEIISKWNILVGKDIGRYSHPKSIKMARDGTNGTLVLAVERGNEIEIEYSKEKIIDKINSFFGYKLISRIRLEKYKAETKKIKSYKNQNIPAKNFEEKINEIKNKEIRNSLSELLNAIKND